MGIENAIANFGVNVGRNIQNTVSNALVQNENRRRYENQLNVLAEQRRKEDGRQKQQQQADQYQREMELTRNFLDAVEQAPQEQRQAMYSGFLEQSRRMGADISNADSVWSDNLGYRLRGAVGKASGGDPKYGLTAFYGKDADGNISAYQLNSAGGAERINLPDGVSPARPLVRSDQGDRVLMNDPLTGRPVTSTPKNVPPQSTAGHAAAVTTAQEEAKNQAGRNAKMVENQKALNVYETAMGGLMQSLGSTDTGPIMGRLPALTAGQQMADGAVAAMAPVLKQLFRASGEGVFTDKDQELLMRMVPTRTTLPEARWQQLAVVDAIVRAKLGGDARTASELSQLYGGTPGFNPNAPDPLGLR